MTHVYADGLANPTITVDLVDEDGTHIGAGSKSVTVNNVAPIIALAGAATVVEDTLYTLNLGAVTDPGDDTVTSYVVDWGDGTSSTYNSAGNVTHTYANAGNYGISVDLVDEDGTFADAGSAAVTVESAYVPEIVRLGDAYPRLTLSDPLAWQRAWTAEEVTITHKADYTNGAEAWSAVKLTGTLPGTLSGGDLFAGDLGVSGKSLPTSSVAQDIDGKEALRFDLDEAATRVTAEISRLTMNEYGGAYDEAGRLQAFDDDGNLVAEVVFVADGSAEQEVELVSEAAFTSVVFTAGAYDGTEFVFGAYDDGGIVVDPFVVGTTTYGSDFMVDAIEFEFAPPEIEPTLVGIPLHDSADFT